MDYKGFSLISALLPVQIQRSKISHKHDFLLEGKKHVHATIKKNQHERIKEKKNIIKTK